MKSLTLFWAIYKFDTDLVNDDFWTLRYCLQHMKNLEQKFRNALNAFRSKLFPPLKRGAAFDVYLTSSGSHNSIWSGFMRFSEMFIEKIEQKQISWFLSAKYIMFTVSFSTNGRSLKITQLSKLCFSGIKVFGNALCKIGRHFWSLLVFFLIG